MTGDETIRRLERELVRRGRTLQEWFVEHLGEEAACDWALAILADGQGRSGAHTHVTADLCLTSSYGAPWTRVTLRVRNDIANEHRVVREDSSYRYIEPARADDPDPDARRRPRMP